MAKLDRSKIRGPRQPLVLLEQIEGSAVAVKKLLLQKCDRRSLKAPGPQRDAFQLAKACEKLARHAKGSNAVDRIEHALVLEQVFAELEMRLHQVLCLLQSSAG